ncbi:MAG: DegT/DnrJ/EryC1/StrS aminotransferase family protein, partial [bacterium]|nr:DegT/DnrJ/EryC1/StrS aminotransferase family protein [bacterium]
MHKTPDESFVSFVERKVPDWCRFAEITEPSVETGRWANFGPTSGAFAAIVSDLIGLPAHRVVVPSSSATTALHAVVGMHNVRAGRKLTWAISAFGFVSTAVGPLGGRTLVVDCDGSGMVDLDLLKRLDPATWDGLIVTDVFGKRADLTDYQDLCAIQSKPLVIDSAVSFPARRSDAIIACEVISFHHTKPWGFGEGGCAVVDERDVDVVRSLLNFGVGTAVQFADLATNGKMSDIAAAAIIDRLDTIDDWAPDYRRQRDRIAALAEAEGLDILVNPPDDTAPPHVPVLMPRPVSLEKLPWAGFAVAKYYRPLSSDCAVARDLFDRIVNVPCHPGMAEV